MRIIAVLLLTMVFTGLTAPPPPWFQEGAEEGLIDDQHFIDSYAEARLRGVDAPNARYGIHNPPFGPDGAFTGTDDQMNVLILLVDFSDNVSQTPAVYFDSLGFASDTFSLANYYGEVSYGQIDIVTVDWPSTTGWQRAPHTYEYYVGGNYGWGSYPTNSQGMVADLCELVDPIVDFSVYDNDSDGYVDGVNVMFAGQFDGTPNTIWPHAWSLPGYGALHDGVYVSTFSVQNEYDNTPGDKSAAVFCHEFGHVMGLPDLYDYGYDSWGIGNWGVMAYGLYNGGSWSPAHLCARSRIGLGIVSPFNVITPGFYEVPAVESSGMIYRLWTDGTAGSQYFLVENRRPIGYDAALPAWGTLIWHIDDNAYSNDNQWYPGYTDYGHYRVALEQADGLWELEQYTSSGDAGDPFPGSTGNEYFNYLTVPDSRNYYSQDTEVTVGAIPVTADTVTIHFSVYYTGIEEGFHDNAEPSLFLLSPNPVLSGAQFEVVHTGGSAALEIFDLSGRKVATLLDEQLPGGVYQFGWNAVERAASIYIARFVSDGNSESMKLVILR